MLNIKELNKKLLLSIDDNYPISLTQGLMGVCIYFYHLYRIDNNEEYKLIADDLLDDILGKLSFESPISVENGLAGIGLGIMHLIEYDFIEGNINVLLEDIDNAIFRNLAFFQPDPSYKKETLLYILYYLSLRLDIQDEESNIYVYRELIIKILNIIVSDLREDFFNEPSSFSVYDFHLPAFTYICACLLKQEFYNNRIYKILEELETKILSTFPVLHANRLYMLCGMLPLVPYMNYKWKYYANLLYKEIRLEQIFEEMSNKHIFIGNGLSLIYLLLHYLENNYSEYKISYRPFVLYDKIIGSEAWCSLIKHDYFFETHQGLFQGFPGTILILSHIKNK